VEFTAKVFAPMGLRQVYRLIGVLLRKSVYRSLAAPASARKRWAMQC
jgi:hypothetical protein